MYLVVGKMKRVVNPKRRAANVHQSSGRSGTFIAGKMEFASNFRSFLRGETPAAPDRRS